MAVPILLLLSEHSLFSVEECISPLNTSIFYTYVVSHHFCFPHNLGNLLSIRIYDISISVDLVHSWHFKCMTYIDQALPEVHINLQEIHGAIIHRENLPLPPKKSYICISFPTQGESCEYKDYLVNMQIPQNPIVQSVNTCRKLCRKEVIIWDFLLLLETSKHLLPREQIRDSHYSA